MNTESQTDRITQLEASFAAMREALDNVLKDRANTGHVTLSAIGKVLSSTDAGKSLLDRLQAVEKELEYKKVRVARLSLAAIEAKACINEWVKSGLITMSPDDEVFSLLEKALQPAKEQK